MESPREPWRVPNAPAEFNRDLDKVPSGSKCVQLVLRKVSRKSLEEDPVLRFSVRSSCRLGHSSSEAVAQGRRRTIAQEETAAETAARKLREDRKRILHLLITLARRVAAQAWDVLFRGRLSPPSHRPPTRQDDHIDVRVLRHGGTDSSDAAPWAVAVGTDRRGTAAIHFVLYDHPILSNCRQIRFCQNREGFW